MIEVVFIIIAIVGGVGGGAWGFYELWKRYIRRGVSEQSHEIVSSGSPLLSSLPCGEKRETLTEESLLRGPKKRIKAKDCEEMSQLWSNACGEFRREMEEIRKKATDEEVYETQVKELYRRLATLFHPDGYPPAGSELWKAAEEYFKKIGPLLEEAKASPGCISSFSQEFARWRAGVERVEELVAEVKATVAEVKATVAEVKANVAEVKANVAGAKAEVAAAVAGAKAEVAAAVAGAKAEAAADTAALRKEFEAFRAQHSFGSSTD